ncbi:uncharacterized protein LOC112602204 [Melanaphis sacchari]|uniref:uncharacterized protein LOC112602204 n=1 Tax=Melanaphis sacchari TaxID=742174 RepID=UPI000DC1407D|nr:uncharacterized protein LOC112602204 [Melanaphis sacchari]
MSSPSANNFHRSSSRIDRLSKPLARLQKPLVRPNAILRKVDNQIPRCKKGLNFFKKEIKVVNPPPQLAKTESGVTRAALKYEASENIKRLAKHRPTLRVVDDKKSFSVAPSSLNYKPSLRIDQLSKPRIRVMKK